MYGLEGTAVLWWRFRRKPAVFCGFQWVGSLGAFDLKTPSFAALLELRNTVQMLTD